MVNQKAPGYQIENFMVKSHENLLLNYGRVISM